MADAEAPRANSLAELLRRGPEPPKPKEPGSPTPPAEEQVQDAPETAAAEATVIVPPPPPADADKPAPEVDASEPPTESTAPEPQSPPVTSTDTAPTEPEPAAEQAAAQPADASSTGTEPAAEESEEERDAAEEAEEAGDATLETIEPDVPEHRPEVEPVQAGVAPIVPPPIPTDRREPAGPAGSVTERRELLSQRLAAARVAAVRKVAEHGHGAPHAEPEPAEQAEDEPMRVTEPLPDTEPEAIAEPEIVPDGDAEPEPAVEEPMTVEEAPVEDGELEPAAYVIETPEAVHPAIDIGHVSLSFQTRDGPVDALSDVSLTIQPGEFVSLIGPSGCGKTTLLRVIADLEKPTDGMVSVDGQTPEEARRNRAYGYVFQAPALYPWRNVAKNVALPLEIMGLGVIERESRIARNLELVNLAGFERKYPWQLSGGMQQRVSIARALAVEPDILLMDEPFGALDEIVRDHLNAQLLDLWAQTGKTVVFVTHSIPEAVFLSSRIVVMTPRPGRICDVIESDLPLDRDLDIRETPEFLEIAHRVRQGLRAGHSYDE